MSFYSMTRCPQTGLYFVLDTLNQQIRVLADRNGDMVGDTILSVYADATWDGFEPLAGMRGVDLAVHLYGGQVPVVTHSESHLLHQIDPNEIYWCLPDMDGNRVANLCASAHGYEFLEFSPTIQAPLPVAGDHTVQIFATWSHTIQVWTCDSLGQNLIFFLGSVIMQPEANAECELSRSLSEGEYILPVDQNNGTRPTTPIRVSSASDHSEESRVLPERITLAPPFPNPFNTTTTIPFDLPSAAKVTLRIYNLLGQQVADLVYGQRSAGSHSIIWQPDDVPSGIYLVRLDAGTFSQIRKLALLK